MNAAIGEYYSVMLSSVLQLVITIGQMFRYVKWEKHKHHSHLHPEMMYKAVASNNLQVLQLLIGCRHADGCEER
jgi:hypothetical protein